MALILPSQACWGDGKGKCITSFLDIPWISVWRYLQAIWTSWPEGSNLARPKMVRRCQENFGRKKSPLHEAGRMGMR